MKLIFAIVQDEDVDNLTDALIADGFRVTRIGSTGSFLRMGNSSLMVGVEDHQVPQVISIIRRVCPRDQEFTASSVAACMASRNERIRSPLSGGNRARR